jgi:hypothetical protein
VPGPAVFTPHIFEKEARMGKTGFSGPIEVGDAKTQWIPGAGVPVDGTSGTGAGTAGIGSIYSDVTNGKLYVNGGTLASPTWKLVTSAA